MGRFKSNVLAPRHRHRPPRDSRDLDGRLSGSLAAFKFAICTRFKKTDPILFGKISHPPDSFISKNEGMAERKTIKRKSRTRSAPASSKSAARPDTKPTRIVATLQSPGSKRSVPFGRTDTRPP